MPRLHLQFNPTPGLPLDALRHLSSMLGQLRSPSTLLINAIAGAENKRCQIPAQLIRLALVKTVKWCRHRQWQSTLAPFASPIHKRARPLPTTSNDNCAGALKFTPLPLQVAKAAQHTAITSASLKPKLRPYRPDLLVPHLHSLRTKTHQGYGIFKCNAPAATKPNIHPSWEQR
jgi:hypothetical protein